MPSITDYKIGMQVQDAINKQKGRIKLVLNGCIHVEMDSLIKEYTKNARTGTSCYGIVRQGYGWSYTEPNNLTIIRPKKKKATIQKHQEGTTIKTPEGVTKITYYDGERYWTPIGSFEEKDIKPYLPTGTTETLNNETETALYEQIISNTFNLDGTRCEAGMNGHYLKNNIIYLYFGGRIILTYNHNNKIMTYEKNHPELKKYINNYKKATKEMMTPEEWQQTIFKHLNLESFKKNKTLTQKYNKQFESIGIKNIIPDLPDNTYQEELTITYNVSTDYTTGTMPYQYSDYYSLAVYETSYPITDEENIIIEAVTEDNSGQEHKEILARYYKNRNIILLHANPWSNEDAINDLLKRLKELKPEKQNAEEFKNRMLINTFMTNINQQITEHTTALHDYEAHIRSYETNLKDTIQQKYDSQTTLELLNLQKANLKDVIFKNLKKMEELQFIEKTEINPPTITITFKPLYMKIQDFQRGIDANSKKYGTRHVYIGRLKFIIGKEINVTNLEPIKIIETVGTATSIKWSAHPHVTSTANRPILDLGQKPCLGDGRTPIYSALARANFEELAMLLYIWAQSYTFGDCYVKPWTFYDARLKQGFQVLDEQEKPIKINDEERIATGEQIRLTPYEQPY